MSSTIRKILIFVAEPMGEKPVIDLAGIGEVLGKGLVNHGFDRAYIVPGQFLLLKDNELFVDWLVDLIHCNVKQASDCWQCLNDWCAEHLKVPVGTGVNWWKMLGNGERGLDLVTSLRC
ncbi:barrier-to-autointegration factor-like [Pollicipes pollicipes]|uniref:barrier-to-autointegration factor-like n=1 Tax=Pollicipes pollicipes TaxID=41117 RepID=UPI0018849917|nr:barrier-to-autointegration factor-like [Pollicipes pollicipes]